MASIQLIKDRLRGLLQKFEIDRAVFFAFLTKAWGAIAGLLTIVLIIVKFSAELQGYYYAFTSLLAMQVLVELGFGTTIVQFASHEWAKLGLDQAGRIIGDNAAFSRLASLMRIAMRWYGIGGLILAVILSFGGCLFFSSNHNPVFFWKMPWITISLLTSISLWLIPIWSILEGCNQVAQLYTFKFIQSVFGTIALWIAILFNLGLWTLIIVNITSLFCAIIFLRFKYSNFLKSIFFSKSKGPCIHWYTEIFPLQWRMALAWFFGYFTIFLFVPFMFKFYGPIAAGQMGLTLSLIGIMGSIVASLLMPNVPLFGILINRKEFYELDKKFWKITRAIFFLNLVAASSIFLGVFVINFFHWPVAGRILPPLPIAIFLIAAIIHGLFAPMGYYLVAHKKMPILWVSVLSGILTCLSTFILGRFFSGTGIAVGYFLVNCFTLFAIRNIWMRCRRAWHNTDAIALNN